MTWRPGEYTFLVRVYGSYQYMATVEPGEDPEPARLRAERHAAAVLRAANERREQVDVRLEVWGNCPVCGLELSKDGECEPCVQLARMAGSAR